MSKGADHRTFYRSDAHWMPTGNTPAATLEVRAMIYREATDPAYVRVADARDKVMLETTLLFSSQRPSAQVALDPARNPAPYRVTLIGNVYSKWTGAADAMVIATDPAAATKMAGLIAP